MLIPLYRTAIALLDEPWTDRPGKASPEQRASLDAARRTIRDAENALDEMWNARRWAYNDQSVLADYERRGIVKGSAWSPAAQERLRRAGKLGE